MIRSGSDIKKAAATFRQQNKLSLIEPIKLRRLLHDNDILTIHLPLSERFHSMGVKIKNARSADRFMLLNSNMSLSEQHFTICHQLYHLCIQNDFTIENNYRTGEFNQSDTEEYNADLFAAYLLLSPEGIMEMIPAEERKRNTITPKTIASIGHYYVCPKNILLNCLQNSLVLIDKNYRSILEKQTDFGNRIENYNSDLYERGNQKLIIGNYETKARKLFDRHIISKSTYLAFLHDIGIDLAKLEAHE